MHTDTIFSPTRAWYALRADLVQQSRAVLTGAGAAAALILALNVLTARGAAPGAGFHAALFPLAMAGGFLFTSTLFTDLHDKPRAHAYLTLPVSTLERWTVRLLLSTVGYAAAALAGFFLVTLLGAGISELVWGRSHGVFAPGADTWRGVLGYLVTSSLFLFGAVYFRRWHAFKVVLATAGLALAAVLLAAGLAWLLVPELIAMLGQDVDMEEIAPGLTEAIELGGRIFFWAVMGPLFWFLTYLRLRDAEV
ncbi:MAG: hypothetical protein OXH96_07335 [Spirochaetaceae bacterium]|nr:hypothetical protein [Spirochaetaceae bacterium]